MCKLWAEINPFLIGIIRGVQSNNMVDGFDWNKANSVKSIYKKGFGAMRKSVKRPPFLLPLLLNF